MKVWSRVARRAVYKEIWKWPSMICIHKSSHSSEREDLFFSRNGTKRARVKWKRKKEKSKVHALFQLLSSKYHLGSSSSSSTSERKAFCIWGNLENRARDKWPLFQIYCVLYSPNICFQSSLRAGDATLCQVAPWEQHDKTISSSKASR